MPHQYCKRYPMISPEISPSQGPPNGVTEDAPSLTKPLETRTKPYFCMVPIGDTNVHHFDILTENGYQTCVCEINYRKGILIEGYWLDEDETPLTESELEMVADICGNTIWRLCKQYNKDLEVDEAYDRWKESRLGN